MNTTHLTASCACGAVAIEAIGRPIASTICYCDDCRAAGAHLESLAPAAPVRNKDGGTPMILYRKDRVRRARGKDLLLKWKLKDGSATNRWIASCCNSAMLLDFDDAKHWANFYALRLPEPRIAPEMRICLKDASITASEFADVPAYRGYPVRFIFKLLAAKAAMIFAPSRFARGTDEPG